MIRELNKDAEILKNVKMVLNKNNSVDSSCGDNLFVI